MIVAVSYAPVIEEILVEKLKEYLYEKCQWNNLYPNHPIRLGNEYPWVPYMNTDKIYAQGFIDLGEVQETLFPSVTVVSSQDSESPQKYADIQRTVLNKDEFDDFKTLIQTTGYMVPTAGLDALETHFLTNNFLYGLEITYQNKDSINFDITTDDPSNIKNRLYDFCSLFLKTHGAFELGRDENIKILKQTVSGNRSGIYNIDFGRVLRGSTIGFEVDYVISQIFYDTDAGLIDDVIIDQTVSVLGGTN